MSDISNSYKQSWNRTRTDWSCKKPDFVRNTDSQLRPAGGSLASECQASKQRRKQAMSLVTGAGAILLVLAIYPFLAPSHKSDAQVNMAIVSRAEDASDLIVNRALSTNRKQLEQAPFGEGVTGYIASSDALETTYDLSPECTTNSSSESSGGESQPMWIPPINGSGNYNAESSISIQP